MDKTYFKCRDDSYYTKYTKEEIFMMMDSHQKNYISNLKEILKDMDYPYFKNIYDRYVQFNIENNFPPEKAIGRYISCMRLRAYKDFGYNEGD